MLVYVELDTKAGKEKIKKTETQEVWLQAISVDGVDGVDGEGEQSRDGFHGVSLVTLSLRVARAS